MKTKIIIFFFFLIQLQAQEMYTTSAFKFPNDVKEVEVNEYEINRVTGDKNGFKKTKYYFLNNLLQSKVETYDKGSTRKFIYTYEANKLVKFESMDNDLVYSEIYMYNKKQQLVEIQALDQNITTNFILFKYNSDGTLKHKIIKETDGFVSCQEDFIYTSKNTYTKRVEFKYLSQDHIIDEYYYENNLEIGSKSDVTGKQPFVLFKKYDDKGNLMEVKEPVVLYFNKYDENGYLTQTSINTNDNLFYTVTEYQYKF